MRTTVHSLALSGALLAAAWGVLASCASSRGSRNSGGMPDGTGAQATVTEQQGQIPSRKLAGQMLICGFSGTSLTDEFRQFLREYYIGNVIVFAGNLRTVEQTRALCAEIQAVVQEATGYPAFICTDQEGGAITRLPKELVSLAGASQFAAAGNADAVYRAGRLTAQQLLLCGINVDFAPVADINSNPANPVIGTRSYGNSAEAVSRYAVQMARGLLDGGVLCCAKHFPGHGDTDTDSHLGLPVVQKSYQALRQFELVPFSRAVAAGVPLVMTAHIMFPQIDAAAPATMSRTLLTEVLRGDLHYSGVIVTDDLEMGAIQKQYGLVQGAVRAVLAGADMLCISVFSDGAAQVSDALVEQVPNSRLLQSAERIYALKQTLPPAEPLSSAQVAERIEAYNRQMRALNALVQ